MPNPREPQRRLGKSARLNRRHDGANVVTQIYVLAFVFASGEGLHDIPMQIRMFPPVTEFDGFRAEAEAVLFLLLFPGNGKGKGRALHWQQKSPKPNVTAKVTEDATTSSHGCRSCYPL